MKIAFIIVTFKTPLKEIERVRQEINEIGLEDFKIYVIDNTNDDKGYAYGVNKGIKKAIEDGSNYFVILTPDISLKGISKETLLAGRKRFNIWGGVIKQNNKTYYGGVIDRLRLTGGLIEDKPAERFTKVDFVSGSLMIIEKNVIKKVGLFDESFFMYYEDVDYCLRAKKLGFNIGIDSNIIYEHFEKSKDLQEKEKLLEKSRWRFFLRNSSLKQKIYEFIRLPKTILETLLKRKFLFNFLSLNFSSFLRKSFNFILFIFLIRTLSLADYGVYTLVWAQTALLAPLVDLGTTSYGLVYLPGDRPKRFQSLFNMRLILSLLIFLLTVFISFFTLKFDGKLVFFTILAGFTIFSNMFSGSYLILSSIREKAYLSSLISTIFNLVFISSLIIILIITKNVMIVFLTIFFFYNLYSLINWLLIRKNLNKFRPKLYDSSWLAITKKSFVFVLIALFANFYFKADVFILNFMKGEKAVAVYSAGFKFLEVLLIIASSYTISATPRLVKLLKENKQLFIEKIKRDSIWLFAFGLMITIFVYTAGGWLLPIILKGGYQDSVTIARIVVLSLPLILLSTIFYNSLYVMKRASLVVYLFIIQFLINFSLNLWLIPHYSYFACAYLTVLSEVINAIISFIFVYENLRRRRGFVSSKQ